MTGVLPSPCNKRNRAELSRHWGKANRKDGSICQVVEAQNIMETCSPILHAVLFGMTSKTWAFYAEVSNNHNVPAQTLKLLLIIGPLTTCKPTFGYHFHMTLQLITFGRLSHWLSTLFYYPNLYPRFFPTDYLIIDIWQTNYRSCKVLGPLASWIIGSTTWWLSMGFRTTRLINKELKSGLFEFLLRLEAVLI